MTALALKLVITASFIVLDVVSGLLKGIMKKQFNSSVMRQGLFHKSAYVIIIALAIMCDYGQRYLQLGFTIPIMSSACVYIVLTEIGSIIENVCTLNPSIVNSKIVSIFEKVPK